MLCWFTKDKRKERRERENDLFILSEVYLSRMRACAKIIVQVGVCTAASLARSFTREVYFT